jgi:hypothetical protein
VTGAALAALLLLEGGVVVVLGCVVDGRELWIWSLSGGVL